MEKTIYFDMDGTLADFYNEPNWLADLTAQRTAPYDNAKPLIEPEDFLTMVNILKDKGYTIGIISWLSRVSTADYKEKVRQSKRNWLNKHFGDVFDEIHLVQYGTPKHRVAKTMPSILVDDNEGINKGWTKKGGLAIHANDIHRILELIP